MTWQAGKQTNSNAPAPCKRRPSIARAFAFERVNNICLLGFVVFSTPCRIANMKPQQTVRTLGEELPTGQPGEEVAETHMNYVKTEKGHQVLKDRSVQLTPRQRSAFIMCDGRNSVGQVLAATAAMGITMDDIDQLVALGLLEESRDMAADAQAVLNKISSERTPQQRYQDAYPIATRLTANMGLRGFRLNLAVEGAGNYEQLRDLAPKIKAAIGPEKFAPLEQALNG
jgi:hypothetical protein